MGEGGGGGGGTPCILRLRLRAILLALSLPSVELGATILPPLHHGKSGLPTTYMES